jgi:hypothetical protein
VLTELQCKEIAAQVTRIEDLERITAHALLNMTRNDAKLIVVNEDEDDETRAVYGKALVSADSLIETTSDGLYVIMCEDFFEDVSERIVRYASQYIVK